METHEESQMLNPREVAEILGIHQKTVHLWLRAGKLEGAKISYRSWRISKTALNNFIEKNKNINQKSEISTKDPITDKKSIKTYQSQIVEQSNPVKTNMKDYIRDIMGED